jgi:hypothetical protein
MADTPDDATQTTDQAATSTVSAFPNPPRIFNDWAIDGPALLQWFKDVTQQNVQQVETIKKLGGGSGDVNPSNLPDPATSNVSTAQKTANDAYIAALAAGARVGMVGTVIISDLATTGDLTFTKPQPDTAYFVLPGQAAASGTPDPGALIIGSIAKTTAKATLTVTVAPGTGKSVSFTVVILRAQPT